MNLKQKTFLVVALSVGVLLLVYVGITSYYIGRQVRRIEVGRADMANTLALEFNEFFKRGVDRLNMVADLPGLLHSLQNLSENRQGRQIAAWTTLHYLFYESDVFTEDVQLVTAQGKIVWTEPPDESAIDTDYPLFAQVARDLSDQDVHFTFWREGENAKILVSVPMRAEDGSLVALLIGEIPAQHPALDAILRRNPQGQGISQLVTNDGHVVAGTDPSRRFKRANAAAPDVMLVSAPIAPRGWKVTIDQPRAEALSNIEDLKLLLTVSGVFFITFAMGSLLFILRSFTRPVEQLTDAARRVGGGDLNTAFTLNRTDEIGILAKTLDDMKTKLKSSYELLLQSEKMALMGQIVAGIAHELNNPLTIVIGNVQLLLMREQNEKNVQSLTRVQDGAERASKIVRNLLTFARQEKPEHKLTDLNAVIRKTLELRVYELKVSNIEVNTELDPQLPETMADPHQLQQVFLNLIVNAEQAMIDSHGKGLLRIKTQLEGGRILIFFSDDGPGISSETLHRIFEPFFTTKPIGKGTGLGLSICQGILSEHGGKIDVESTLGRGATFILEIPVRRWAPAETPKETAVKPVSAGRKKILVVEDETQIRQLFEEVLKAEGHIVETVGNGKTAMDMINRESYDLIICDVKMPELDGPAFYAFLKRKGTALERRVIFVTGDLMNPETMQFLVSTGRAWLGKPFDIEAITKTVADSLQ